STLPISLMEWINNLAKKNKSTKKEIIVTALENYKDQIKRESLAESFERASKDPEMKIMAEEGLDDTLNQINKLSLGNKETYI
ncbi:hypothetical protein K9M41_01110, partial [Candidatus Gracilibacteria bacterium]|nr:hypothetical protein [Candidatus Gracilibacteria bacterium]